MKEPTFLTDEQKAAMVALYADGMSDKECVVQFHCDKTTVLTWLKAFGVPVRPMKIEKRKYHCDELAFSRSTTESAYWLGFLLADGCIHEHRGGGSLILSVSVAQKDIGHLQQLQQFLQSDHPLHLEPQTNSVRFYLRSDVLCQSLLARGCAPAKSLILEYPASGFFHRRHFIRGYFDGDGSLYVNEKVYCQATVSFVGTHNFLEQLQEILVCEAGIRANAIRNHARSNAKYLSYTGRGNVKKLYDYFYAEDGPCLERKKAKFEYALSYRERKDL